jgi:hypothetical protein
MNLHTVLVVHSPAALLYEEVEALQAELAASARVPSSPPSLHQEHIA